MFSLQRQFFYCHGLRSYNKKGKADFSASPEFLNQLFAAVDADKGNDADENHGACSAEADDIFQIL